MLINFWCCCERILTKNTISFYCTNTTKSNTSPKALYKYLLRQCHNLPDGPNKYYSFMIKQSFKQHINETDPERIKQIIERSYEDASWVLKKYLAKK